MRAPIDNRENTLFSSLNLGQITPQKRKIGVRKQFLQTLRVKLGMRVCLPLLMKVAIALLSLTPQKTYSACAVNTVSCVNVPPTISLPAPGTTIISHCCSTGDPVFCTDYYQFSNCTFPALCIGSETSPHYPTCSACPSSMTPYIPGPCPSPAPIMPPSAAPTGLPSTTLPSIFPSRIPSTTPSFWPSLWPSQRPSGVPSLLPTGQPSGEPSGLPTGAPSHLPTLIPSTAPTREPSIEPSTAPTDEPSSEPSTGPTVDPSPAPTIAPSRHPSGVPTLTPSADPTNEPSVEPAPLPTSEPTDQLSSVPSHISALVPSKNPTGQPALRPSFIPISTPPNVPLLTPTVQTTPSLFLTDLPSVLNATLGGLVANLTRNLTSNTSSFLENVTSPLVNLTTNLTNTGSVPLSPPAGDMESSWVESPYFIGPVVAVSVAAISFATYKIGKWWLGKKSQEDKEGVIAMSSISHHQEEENSVSSHDGPHSERSIASRSSQPHTLDGISHPESWTAKQNDLQLGPRSYQPGPHTIEEDKAFSFLSQDQRPPVPRVLSPHEADGIELTSYPIDRHAPRMPLGAQPAYDDPRGGF